MLRGLPREIKFLERISRELYIRELNKAKLNSDKESYDEEFNPSHTHSKECEKAYINGEAPKSYLSKKVMLQKLEESMYELKLAWENKNGVLKDINPLPIKILSFIFSSPIRETCEKISKELNKDEIFNRFFIYSGFHYMGKYYRYTKFYKCKQGQQLILSLINTLYKPPACEQLKLKGLNNG